MSDKTMGEAAREAYHLAMNVDLSELDEWWECVKDGDAHAWQAAAESVTAPLRAEIATLRHDLLNEQAASRMAHEVVARNRVLEAENAQLRHALANAEVAAGFAKEMAAKVKVYRKSLELIATDYEHCEESIGFGDRAGAYRETARHTLESQP